MLTVYDNLDFVSKNRIPDLTPNTVRLAPVFEKYGIKEVYSHKEVIKINDTSRIYPDTYFCTDTSESFCVHHFQASWINDFDCKVNIHIPLGKNKWFGFYRYKRINPVAVFLYPKTMVKKLLELDLTKRKKILITYEREEK